MGHSIRSLGTADLKISGLYFSYVGLPFSHLFSFVRSYPLDNFMYIFTSNKVTCVEQEPGNVSALWEELHANLADALETKQRLFTTKGPLIFRYYI